MKERCGEWTVIGPSPSKKYYSRCQCSCGVIKDINNSTLRLGKSTSCGHNVGKMIRERLYAESDAKVIGNKFGRLIAIKRINNIRDAEYLCRCDCGNKVVVRGIDLTTGGVWSCGCLRSENSKKLMEIIKKTGHDKLEDGFVEGTNIYSLDQKISKNSSTRVKGVSKMKNGKYRAYINIRRQQINLGIYATLEEAKEARLQAEKDIYEPIVREYRDKDKDIE